MKVNKNNKIIKYNKKKQKKNNKIKIIIKI